MNTDLLKIESVPALLKTNFKEVEEHLKAELAKYDVVVTEETLKSCKALATELNKAADHIDTLRKAEVVKVSGPITEFDGKMKTLVALCKTGREKLTTQIAQFENKVKGEILDMLQTLMYEVYDEQGVTDEFRTADVSNLAILTNQTKAGNLTASAAKEVEARVMLCLAAQNKVAARLLMLEHECLKAGLKTPLERAHIEAFLLHTDEFFARKLETLIEIEQKRQKAAEEVVAPELEPVPESEPEPVKAQAVGAATKPVGMASSSQAGMITHTLRATFVVKVPEHITAGQVADKLRRVMTEAGITSLSSITVVQ